MRDLKLSNLKLDTDQTPEVIDSMDPNLEIARVKTNYNQELSKRKVEILSKIENLEKKIKKHELKEGMLDMIISGTYVELENLKENEFSRRGQKQTVLIKQLEALSVLHDTILKYEDMIQKYHKILMDLENNKFNSYIKIESIKKEEDKADDNLQAVLENIQGMMNNQNISFIDDIKQELTDNDY